MISPKDFFDTLRENEIEFFAGVPDSLLKDFCAYLSNNVKDKENIITANEGGAIALVSGYHLATGKTGLVYMQNSGQGNCVNPLISLADSEVYSIPMLLLIGWRGEPGKKDEPQHIKQGKITLELLKTLRIPYEILPDSTEKVRKTLERATRYLKKHKSPCAIIVKKETFEECSLKNKAKEKFDLSREQAIKLITNHLELKDIVVSTTGKTSRELFEYREELGQKHEKDFLTVGSMGHSSQIALGIALKKPKRKVYCFDGDGAFIMHMGGVAIIGQRYPKNFKHIVFNNGAHDSVGGQPTTGLEIDIPQVARACGYKAAFRVKNKEELERNLNKIKKIKGPVLLEVQVNKGSRKDLGRPTTTPLENKRKFMEFLESK